MVRARASRVSTDPLPDPEAILAATKEPDFRQERARRSYLALIDAATTLFAKRGYDAVGTPEIAQEAGVSVGTFYRYFEDKHEIYVEIARRTMITAYRVSVEGLTPQLFVGRGRRETIAAAVTHLFANVLERPELSRSFTEMSLRDAQVAELRRALEQLSIRRLTMLIDAVVPRDVIADPEAAAFVIYTLVMEAAYSLVGQFGPPPLDAERTKAAVTLFIERALFPT
nr:TetR/AcrR family transcriptional regulator [Deltaproteobacteria bacterium]